MTEALVASVVVLWVVVLVLAVAVFALARQIGVLHGRLAPAGALMTTAGPKVGELAPTRTIETLDGRDPERHRRYVQDMGIEQYPCVVSLELGMRFEVGKLPCAVLVGADGVLRSKGLVNNREHLESLVEAMDSGFESIQDYLFREERLERAESSAQEVS